MFTAELCTQFGCELYAKYETWKIDDNDPTNEEAKSGRVENFGYTKRSQTGTLRGSLHTDFLRQEPFFIEPTGYSYQIIAEQTRIFPYVTRGRYP